jgi:hypothetical protein
MRKDKNRRKTAAMTSNQYFKKLQGKSNQTLGRYRRSLSKNKFLKKIIQLKYPNKNTTPDMDSKNEESTMYVFCDEIFSKCETVKERVECSIIKARLDRSTCDEETELMSVSSAQKYDV